MRAELPSINSCPRFISFLYEFSVPKFNIIYYYNFTYISHTEVYADTTLKGKKWNIKTLLDWWSTWWVINLPSFRSFTFFNLAKISVLLSVALGVRWYPFYFSLILSFDIHSTLIPWCFIWYDHFNKCVSLGVIKQYWALIPINSDQMKYIIIHSCSMYTLTSLSISNSVWYLSLYNLEDHSAICNGLFNIFTSVCSSWRLSHASITQGCIILWCKKGQERNVTYNDAIADAL